MADATTTRRALLGAIASLPAIAIAAPALAQPIGADRGDWDQRFAAFQDAHTAWDTHKREVYQPIIEAGERASAHIPNPGPNADTSTRVRYIQAQGEVARAAVPGYYEVGERNDELCDLRTNLGFELLEVPAPDGEALLWKLEFLFEDDLRDGSEHCSNWHMDQIRAIVTDARRLLSVGRA